RFARHAAFFRKRGWLTQCPDQWTGSKQNIKTFRVSLVRKLGGVSFHANWSNMADFPFSRYADQVEDRAKIYDSDRVLPQTEDGRDFHYVGEIEMWNYIEDTNGVLMLFFDPQDRIALKTIDWS